MAECVDGDWAHENCVALGKTSQRLSFFICKMGRIPTNLMVSMGLEEVKCCRGGKEFISNFLTLRLCTPESRNMVLYSSNSPTLTHSSQYMLAELKSIKNNVGKHSAIFFLPMNCSTLPEASRTVSLPYNLSLWENQVTTGQDVRRVNSQIWGQ